MEERPSSDRTIGTEPRHDANLVRSDRDTELGRVLQTIQQLECLNFSTDDANERMQQVDVVQDELIKQLDELNQLVQQQIDRLTENRSVEPPTSIMTKSV